MKPALGTAQFGLNYGITNQDGKVSDQELLSKVSYRTLRLLELTS